MWFKVEIQSTSAVRTLNHSGDLSVIPQTSIRTLSPVNIALGCQKPCLSKSSAVLCPPRPDVPITAWEKKGGQSECYWVLVKTKLFKKEMWHLMLGVVFNQRVISTLGQRSPRRKCWNTLETVTVRQPRTGHTDVGNQAFLTSHWHIVCLSNMTLQHRVKVSPSWTWHNSSVSWLIVQNIFLIIYHIFLNEIVGWGKDFWAGDENGIWEVIRLQKLGLMPPKQFGEIYLIDMLCFSKL